MKITEIGNHESQAVNLNTSTNSNSKERISFRLPPINRSCGISLGHAIIQLIAINQASYISVEDHKENIALMFVDILNHFDITLEEVHKANLLEAVLDPDYDYELETALTHKVIKKTLR